MLLDTPNYLDMYEGTCAQCYNIGDPCKVDSDCLAGGFNPCNKCGTSHGTQYYKRCYSEPVTFEPTPAPTEVGMCGQSCWNNADCKSQYAGTWNPCMVCSRNHGAKAGLGTVVSIPQPTRLKIWYSPKAMKKTR